MARRPVPIDELLQWAYRDELPKRALAVGGSDQWDSISDYGERGGVDVSWTTRPQRYAHIGTPHPDALALEWLVRNLEDFSAPWAWVRAELVPDVHQFLRAEDTEKRAKLRENEFGADRHARIVKVAVTAMQASPAALVAAHARTGSRPIWDIGKVKVERLIGANGKPVVNGITAGNRYGLGAHCPVSLYPPAEEIAAARFDYAVWRDALAKLASESWSLKDFEPLPPTAAARPWICDDEPKRTKPRVLETIAPSIVPQHEVVTVS